MNWPRRQIAGSLPPRMSCPCSFGIPWISIHCTAAFWSNLPKKAKKYCCNPIIVAPNKCIGPNSVVGRELGAKTANEKWWWCEGKHSKVLHAYTCIFGQMSRAGKVNRRKNAVGFFSSSLFLRYLAETSVRVVAEWYPVPGPPLLALDRPFSYFVADHSRHQNRICDRWNFYLARFAKQNQNNWLMTPNAVMLTLSLSCSWLALWVARKMRLKITAIDVWIFNFQLKHQSILLFNFKANGYFLKNPKWLFSLKIALYIKS